MTSRLDLLQDRAALFRKVRDFFHEKGVLEVDCPLLSAYAAVDAHIDLIPTLCCGTERRYLHSSPEYGMKRLLVEGMGDIYQMSHVFRDGEYGQKHNPEFLLVEWYRVGISFDAMIEETMGFAELFLGEQLREKLSYQEAFLKYCDLDPFTASEEQLRAILGEEKGDNKDDLLNQLLGLKIEPQLGQNGLTVLHSYPANQAALAKTAPDAHGNLVAQRFEIYHRGYELANGYDELSDAKEQRQRFHSANQQRKALGKQELLIDEQFLQALEKGMPACCGVAVGFDRLMMLRHNSTTLQQVLPMGWEEA